jgi:hypothetical protein
MKRAAMAIVLAFGFGSGCADGPEDFEFRGAGAYFCCDAAGACFYTSDGDCGPGELLGWCPLTTQSPTGATICKDWG